MRPASSTHNLRITREDPNSGVQKSSSNKNLAGAKQNGHHLETNIYLNDQNDFDDFHQNMSITTKTMHARQQQSNNGNGDRSPEKNIQLHHEEDDGPLHWRYSPGGAAGYVDNEDDEEVE